MFAHVSVQSKQQADLREAPWYKHVLMGHTLTTCAWQYLTETLHAFVHVLMLLRLACILCACVVVCLVALVLLSAAGTRTHTHSTVGAGTGRQLNRSAWGNLGCPAGGGRRAAGGSRTGENSNTSDGHALCFTGRRWGTHTHTHIATLAWRQQERKMIKKLESGG